MVEVHYPDSKNAYRMRRGFWVAPRMQYPVRPSHVGTERTQELVTFIAGNHGRGLPTTLIRDEVRDVNDPVSEWRGSPRPIELTEKDEMARCHGRPIRGGIVYPGDTDVWLGTVKTEYKLVFG